MKNTNVNDMSKEQLEAIIAKTETVIKSKQTQADKVKREKEKTWKNRVPVNFDGRCPRTAYDPSQKAKGGWETLEILLKIPYHNGKKAAVLILQKVRKHFTNGAVSVDFYTLGGMYRDKDGKLQFCGVGRYGNTVAQMQLTEKEAFQIAIAIGRSSGDGHTFVPTADLSLEETIHFGKKEVKLVKHMGRD